MVLLIKKYHILMKNKNKQMFILIFKSKTINYKEKMRKIVILSEEKNLILIMNIINILRKMIYSIKINKLLKIKILPR